MLSEAKKNDEFYIMYKYIYIYIHRFFLLLLRIKEVRKEIS